MGSDDIFKKSKADKDLKRKRSTKKIRDRILIVCEGEKTEPIYFEGFRLPNVVVKGTGYNTDRLVTEAIKINKQARKDGEPFDQVWCVFDRDSFPASNFTKAIILAEQNNFRVAHSNESFELWYLLHFNYYDSGLSRHDYILKLDELLEFKYEKNCSVIYEVLKDKQTVAIRNADKLLNQYQPFNPEKDKPSTTVHLLVQQLNKWVK